MPRQTEPSLVLCYLIKQSLILRLEYLRKPYSKQCEAVQRYFRPGVI